MISDNMRVDFSKIFFMVSVATAVIVLAFAAGLYSGATENAVFRVVRDTRDAVSDAFRTMSEEASTLAGTHPRHFLEPARRDGAGVTVNQAADDSELVFMSGFFVDTNELRLMTRDGTIVHRWPVVFSEIFPDDSHAEYPPATDWNIETSGAVALPDGSVVFNFAYAGLVKLDRCGAIQWKVAEPTHHSVERAEDGGYWVPGRRLHAAGQPSPFPPYDTPFSEDTLLKVSATGEIENEISVPQIFYDNGLEALFTATGYQFFANLEWDRELLHVNKIAELGTDLAADFPNFAAGDLLLSMRNLNLLMVVDAEGKTVKWWKIGPWLRQHDPEYKRGGKIVLFNNNIYRRAEALGAAIPQVSNIIEVDPQTNEHRILFGGRDDQQLLSVIGAKVDVTPRDGIFVTEFGGGRVFEADSEGRIIWEYINRYDEDEVAEIIEGRLYRKDYFDVVDWDCNVSAN